MKLGCLEYEKKNSANVKIKKKKTQKTTNTEKKYIQTSHHSLST